MKYNGFKGFEVTVCTTRIQQQRVCIKIYNQYIFSPQLMQIIFHLLNSHRLIRVINIYQYHTIIIFQNNLHCLHFTLSILKWSQLKIVMLKIFPQNYSKAPSRTNSVFPNCNIINKLRFKPGYPDFCKTKNTGNTRLTWHRLVRLRLSLSNYLWHGPISTGPNFGYHGKNWCLQWV